MISPHILLNITTTKVSINISNSGQLALLKFHKFGLLIWRITCFNLENHRFGLVAAKFSTFFSPKNVSSSLNCFKLKQRRRMLLNCSKLLFIFFTFHFSLYVRKYRATKIHGQHRGIFDCRTHC